jgi:hypothetical protein
VIRNIRKIHDFGRKHEALFDAAFAGAFGLVMWLVFTYIVCRECVTSLFQ